MKATDIARIEGTERRVVKRIAEQLRDRADLITMCHDPYTTSHDSVRRIAEEAVAEAFRSLADDLEEQR